MTRVTERSIASSVLAGLQANLHRLGETQARLSSGKQLTRPSDSPSDTVAAMQYRSEMSALRQYVRNADDGLGWLGVADTALSGVIEQVGRARAVTIQGISGGSFGSQESRNALADELDGIRDAVIGMANVSYLDRPIFGGTTSGTSAFSSSGTYAGDTGTVLRTLGTSTKVRVDVSAAEVFGTGTEQLFTVLADVATSMRTDPRSLAANLARLEAASSAVQGGHSAVGARYTQVNQMRQSADDRAFALTGQLSDIEDIDLPKTITELQLQQTAYQAALAATARVVQPSLVDFLR